MIEKTYFLANLSELKKVMPWIQEHIAKAGFLQPDIRRIELAMEEALVNIMQHAHLSKTDLVELTCAISDTSIEFILKDKGAPFNPLTSLPQINSTETLEQKKEGGLGLFMIKKFMDELFYERQEPYNVLHLKKRKSQNANRKTEEKKT